MKKTTFIWSMTNKRQTDQTTVLQNEGSERTMA